jgi:hypothetical protein
LKTDITLFQLGAEDLGKAGAEQPAANEYYPDQFFYAMPVFLTIAY